MSLEFKLNGKPVYAEEGTTVASAVFDEAPAGGFRTSVSGEPRSALCGMGICFECRLRVNGLEHQRTCQLPIQEGLCVETESAAGDPSEVPFDASRSIAAGSPLPANTPQSFDVAVLGGGPAGIAAAVAAGEAGRSVALIDDNPAAGGQIWRRSPHGPPKKASAWLERLRALPALTRFSGAPVIDLSAPEDGNAARVTVLAGGEARGLAASSVVLATGARELFLPFPGWTLPGVVGAGGLQALIKSGLDVDGKRLVIAGSGPLLLAVAALARAKGAKVLVLAEQADRRALMNFGAGLWRHPSKLAQAAFLNAQLFGIPRAYGVWPVAASGGNRLQRVRLSDGRELECDLLACGFGLCPESGLARFLGADVRDLEIGPASIQVDERQETSVPGVFAAGECTGIGGVDAALIQGQMAGLAAAGQPRDRSWRALGRERHAAERFARALARTFRLRGELLELPAPDTIVCRCEDVRWRELEGYGSQEARRAKLETRCGMGPCQGRVCGGALHFLLGFGTDRIRPPFFPAPLSGLMMAQRARGETESTPGVVKP